MKKKAPKSLRVAKDIMTLSKMLLIVFQVALFVVSWEWMQPHIKFYAQISILLYLIYGAVLFWMHRTYDSLRVGSFKVTHLCTGQFLSIMISNVLLFLLCMLAIRKVPHIGIFIGLTVAQIILSFLWCIWANKLFSYLTPIKNTVIIHQNENDLASLQVIFRTTSKYDVSKTLCAADYDQNWDALKAELTDAEAIFIGDIPKELRSQLVLYGLDHGKNINLRPDLNDVLIATSRHRFQGNIPTLKVGIGTAPLPVRIVKRAMDIAASSLLLLFTSPIMAVVAILIKKEDHGPVLYRQKRLTIGGKVFEILKFRSMRVDAEKDGVARLATEKDDRITKIGHLIRATRLDELPQLWNIFKGDMSLVGPRPERPEIAAQYLNELPQFNARLQVKAGLTGYAQVNGKYNTTPEDKLEMDLMYISEMSISLDIKLILQTIHIMMKKESTEGIQEGSTTASKKAADEVTK